MIKRKPPQHLLCPPELALESLTTVAWAGYTPGLGAPVALRRRCYDTFDWRLFAKGLTLVREERAYHLYDLNDGRELAVEPESGQGRYLFGRDFPPGPLRGRLEKISEIRALLPLLILEVVRRPLELLNNDRKIVIRGSLLELTPKQPGKAPLPVGPPPADAPTSLRLLILEPVTGYLKPLEQVRSFLLERGLEPVAAVSERLYRMAGYRPGAYSQKLNIRLEPDWPAARAALAILHHQCRVLRQNEAGIIADLDSEFLHDFRVALRRSRAALARLKRVLPPGVAGRFRGKLGELAKASNQLRDLDVYLLKKEEYRQLLPPCLQLGLEPLFAALEVERRRERQRLVRKLKSPAWQRVLEQWEEFLAGYDFRAAGAGKGALEPVDSLAAKAIAKACARVLAHGRAIGPDSPDRQFHALRLDCKRLRYLFEFFATLFPPATIGPLIAQSKKLQDNLGTFNDLFVQQERLRQFLAELEEGGGRQPQVTATAAALGGLIARLHRRQQRVRGEFAKTFRAFAACQYRKQLCPEA